MSTHQKKSPYCLNCGEEFFHDESYCPSCGQENKDSRMPLRVFLGDFFSSFLNFDAVFFRTVPVFLARPGLLTLAFNGGRRKSYIHPIKLYLLMSLFYFFVFGLVVPRNALDVTVMSTEGKLTPEAERRLAEIRVSLSEEELVEFDSVVNKGVIQTVKQLWPQSADVLGEEQLDWRTLKLMAIDPSVSDEEFEEVYAGYRYHIGTKFSTSKIRAFIANSGLFISGVARNLPIMMFFLLPFFALILQLLYVRGSFYFVEHLIHGLHLHSFAYLIYGVAISWDFWIDHYSEQVLAIAFLLVSSYAYFSMKKVYEQGKFKTLIKFLLLGTCYLLFLLLGLIIEVYVTLLLF